MNRAELFALRPHRLKILTSPSPDGKQAHRRHDNGKSDGGRSAPSLATTFHCSGLTLPTNRTRRPAMLSLIAPTSALLGLLFLTSPAKLPRADSALARWQSRYLRLAASSRIPGAQVDPK